MAPPGYSLLDGNIKLVGHKELHYDAFIQRQRHRQLVCDGDWHVQPDADGHGQQLADLLALQLPEWYCFVLCIRDLKQLLISHRHAQLNADSLDELD